MSLAHVRMSKVCESDVEAVYLVETPDFDRDRAWKSVGTLTISKTKKTYAFEMSALAKDRKVLPPELFGIDEKERKRLLGESYQDFGWGAWSMRIHAWAERFAAEQFFPDTYPPLYVAVKQGSTS